MADDAEVDNEMFDISTLSEAERRRLRRRQRILGNQGARLQRILNNDSGASKEGNGKTGSRSSIFPEQSTMEPTPSIDSVDGVVLKGEPKSTTVNEGFEESRRDSSSPSSSPHNRRSSDQGAEPSLAASLLRELSEVAGANQPSVQEQENSQPETPRMGVQSDGTVILPKVSEFSGRVLICLLALFLSLLNAKRFSVTFIAWEVGFYYINGLPPLPPPNMAMVLAAVMGLQENQLIKIKSIIHFSNCVLMDFSLFLLFVLMPHIVKNLAAV